MDYMTWAFVYLGLGPSSAWTLGRRTSCPTPRAGTAEHIGDLVEVDGAQESHSAFVLCVPTATRFLPGCACADIKKFVILGVKSS